MRRRYSAMDVDLLVLIRKFSVLTPIITVCYRSRSENKRPFYLESCSGGLVVKVADFSPQLWPPAIIFHWGALHSLPPAHWGEGLNAELCHNDNKSLFLLFFSFPTIKLTFLEMSLLRSQSHLKKTVSSDLPAEILCEYSQILNWKILPEVGVGGRQQKKKKGCPPIFSLSQTQSTPSFSWHTRTHTLRKTSSTNMFFPPG